MFFKCGEVGILLHVLNGAMQLKFVHKRINLGLFLALALIALVGTAYLSYFSYARTLNNYNWVGHSQEVLRLISDGQSKMYETESAVRAYVILQQSKYRPDLAPPRRMMDSLLRDLRIQTTDNAEQQQLLTQIDPVLNKRFALWRHLVVDLFTLDLYTQDSLLLEGLRASQSANHIWEQMRQEEYLLLSNRVQQKQSGVYSSPLFLLGASVVSIVIVALLFFLLRHSFRESEDLRLEMQKQNIELLRSNQDLEQFAYVASHDLQEPLRKLRAFSERLRMKEEGRLSEEGKEIILKLDGFAAKMQRLIDDLLQFSRVINSKVEGENVDLNLILQESKTTLHDSIIKKGAVISSTWLPIIKGYESQMMQLFQNLLSNSIKYARADVAPVINIVATIVDGHVVPGLRKGDEGKLFHKIQFTDNGIGFNAQYAERIFVVFQRLHGKSEYEGTGIGLAISKSVVLNHGGYITADSEEGKGAVFTVYLPVAN